MPGETFDKGKRLLTSADFGFVFDNATFKVSHRCFLLLARRNPDGASGESRLGLVIAKKNIRLATRRNRAKRVARETFRTRQVYLDSLDIVFMARRGFDSLAPAEQTRLLTQAWRDLAARAAGG